MKFLQENDISSQKIEIVKIPNIHNDYIRRNNESKIIDKIKILLYFLIIFLFLLLYNKLDENRIYIDDTFLKFSNFLENNNNEYNASKKNEINNNSNIFPFLEKNNKRIV